MYCGEGTLVNHAGHNRQATTLTCNAWSCESCNPMRRARLRRLAGSGDPSTFITLTCRAAPDSDRIDLARRLVTAWRTVRRRAAKRFHLTAFPFLAVFEAHKSGFPHLHILARVKYIPHQWLSEQMQELLDSPIVDIRIVKNRAQAAVYVAKYVGKQPGKFGTLKRYWHSVDYVKVKKAKRGPADRWGDCWEISKKSIGSWARQWVDAGWTVQWQSLRRIEARRFGALHGASLMVDTS